MRGCDPFTAKVENRPMHSVARPHYLDGNNVAGTQELSSPFRSRFHRSGSQAYSHISNLRNPASCRSCASTRV